MENHTQDASYTSEFERIFQELLQRELDRCKNEEEQRKLLARLERADFDNLVRRVIKSISKSDFKTCKSEMFERVCSERLLSNEFKARQEQKWNKPLATSEMLYIMVLEAAEYYVEYVSRVADDERRQKANTYWALRNIHGRGMQIYLEILELMKGGFADGAYARWRSLYELTIYGSFIAEHGEAVAKAFCEASESEEEYPNWAKTSGFFKNTRGNLSFRRIEEKTNLNTAAWNKQYKLACKITHASPQATFKRLGNYPISNDSFIPIDRSDYGLTTPGEHSAVSLVQLSIMFFNIFPEGTTLARMITLNKWIDVVREAYFKTHDEVFPEDERLWMERSS